jgi:hypothetical protein
MVDERTKSPAYLALRASARRLLLFIETEVARQGGGAVTIYADQFSVVGSIRIVRRSKRHVISLSGRRLARSVFIAALPLCVGPSWTGWWAATRLRAQQ